jgi:hypothetical protein
MEDKKNEQLEFGWSDIAKRFQILSQHAWYTVSYCTKFKESRGIL